MKGEKMFKYDYVRTSTSIPRDDYENLVKIAREKKSSISWVIRQAVEVFLAQQKELQPPRKESVNDEE